MRHQSPDPPPSATTLADTTAPDCHNCDSLAGFSQPKSPSPHHPIPAAETHSLLPSSLVRVIRYGAEKRSVKERIEYIVGQTEAESISIFLTSRDLAEITAIHSSKEIADPTSIFDARMKKLVLERGPLTEGIFNTFCTAKGHHKGFYQVGPAPDQDQVLVILIEGPEEPKDQFFSTLCHFIASLLLNETAKEMAFEALQRSERMLQQSQRLANMGQLTSGVAHDFNNLLTVIQGHLAMIENEYPEDEGLQDSIERVSAATERAVELSRQLLSFGKEKETTFESCDLNETIRRFERLIARMLEENVEVSVDLADDVGMIEADQGLLTQILMNLVVNARDAMPNGGKIFISTSRLQTNANSSEGLPINHVSLKVKDTGSGIPQEDLARIFEPYFSTKEKKGTGLGLANVASIMRQHNGRIDVTSEAGKGTEFELIFPQKSISVASPQKEKPQDESDSNKAPFQNKGPFKGTHVLLVEDEQSVRRLVRKLLEMIGCTVTESPSGKDALERWPSLSDDITLIVSDVMMPGGVSGWELARQIHKSNPNLGILLTSGYSERPEDHGLEGVAEVSFLQKPYDIAKLKEELQTLSLPV